MPRKYEYRSVDLGEIGSGLHIFIESVDLQLSSSGAMLDKFNATIEEAEPMTAKPLGKKLNPDIGGVAIHQNEDVWMYVFRGNFYVNIIRHLRYVSGPHAARLMYKSYQTGQVFWIATLQICDCMFFNEEQMDMQMFNAVYNKLWYISERSKKDKVAV